jgi:uncharacterized Fe-S cluster protein YjdI/CDGSH-type Zn-finger protein
VKDRIKNYSSDTITVRFEPRRCIHAAECVRGLPTVFDPGRKPWIEVGGTDAEAIARVVERCPTGALHFERHDGGAAEAPDAVNQVRVTRNGPLHLRGTIELRADDGSVVARDVRVALCRCGASQNRPFCDNSHRAIRFVDPGDVFEGRVEAAEDAADRTLRVTPKENGPYRLEGPFELTDVDGRVRITGKPPDPRGRPELVDRALRQPAATPSSRPAPQESLSGTIERARPSPLPQRPWRGPTRARTGRALR